jgi:hypothetical protein
VQAPLPEHAPDQPENIDPLFAEATKVTVPEAYLAEQVEPQLIPEGLLVIVPDPEPDFETVKLYETDLAKVAATDFAAVIVTVQAPVPEHDPDQPEKVDPLVGEAAKVTDFPDS